MNPVEYTGPATGIVEAFNALPMPQKTGAYWSDVEVNDVRKLIKDHYIAEQGQRCCYCRREYLTSNNSVWDAEHVISRDAKPQFMFEPLNLAVACKDCNIAKGEQNVLCNKTRVTFPSNSSDYLIVHPHLDVYDDYILWYGPVVAAATSASSKGPATISMCNLLRFSQRFGHLKGDLLDQRYRDRVGELLTARTRQSAESLLAELALHIAGLPDGG
jgi:hypothetical protein